ncbi:MAG: hypothetical protein HY064_15635 [Bacteroidetes bacterium]|nr:hypothetical protein [Bacteroidota bacterium]
MNQPNPFINPLPPPQQKFKGLILAANIVSSILMAAALFTFIHTIQRSHVERRQSFHNRDLDMVADSIRMADSLNAIMNAITTAPAATDYDNSSADLQESMNELQYDMVKTQAAGHSNETEIINALDELKQQSDEMANYIRSDYRDFTDYESNLAYYAQSDAAKKFFIDQDRASTLKDRMVAYRARVIVMMAALHMSDAATLRESLPMDDSDYYGYNTKWDESNFNATVWDAQYFLKQMESEVREFEGSALDKLPQIIK